MAEAKHVVFVMRPMMLRIEVTIGDPSEISFEDRQRAERMALEAAELMPLSGWESGRDQVVSWMAVPTTGKFDSAV